MPVDRFKSLLDEQAQNAIISVLIEEETDVTLISEEGNKVLGDGCLIMTSDPVDGTTNLARGLSPAVSSISLSNIKQQHSVFAGMVSNFFTGETFYAEKGKGATLDGKKIRVSQDIQYQHGLIGMDISKKPLRGRVRRLMDTSRHIRQQGCCAMSLCNVASGRLDAHIDLRGMIRATDISAGLLIIREAGGVYGVNGNQYGDFPLTRDTKVELVAANGLPLLNQIQSIMG